MAGRLPSGVFKCEAKDSEKEEDATLEASKPLTGKVHEFSFQEGFTHMISTNEVDKNFCDASSPLSLSGYLDVQGSKFDKKSNKHLFYWFFEKRTTSQINGEEGRRTETNDSPTPLVVWLTGGPGCSSSLALLTENGPCSVADDGKTTQVNPYAWTESAHVLWLDQPADVGYSYGAGNDKNEEMISEDAYFFLQAFFKSDAGSKYKNSPLHIVGESYGGHYAPAIAHRVWRGNKEMKDGLLHLPLAGVAIGNGLTDPEEQYQWYGEMAFKNSHGIKAISESTYDSMKTMEPGCKMQIHQCNKGDNFFDSAACQTAFISCNMALTTPYRMSGLNPYDISKKCGDNPLCYDFSHIETFMNQQSTKDALHVADHAGKWQTCNMAINMKFHTDWMKDFSPYVRDLLNDGIPTLVYAGDLDFICNYLGNRAWTLGLDWDKKEEFKNADEKDWNNGDGMARTAGGLTFLQVYDAGHMVPSDQPKAALTMITQFLNGEIFG